MEEPLEYSLSQTMLYTEGVVFHYLFIQWPIASVFPAYALLWIAAKIVVTRLG